MKKRNVILGTAAVILVLTASVPSSLAYFTTYVSAKGEQEVVLQDDTRITESVTGHTKSITITADEKSEPVYVRAKAFGPDGYTLTYSGNGWTSGEDDFWYYATPISKGASAETLNVAISGIPSTAQVGDNFNVIVIYEYTPELFKEENGVTVSYADWTKKVTYSGTSESEIDPANPTNPSSGTDTGSTTDEGGAGTETGGGNG